MDVKSEVYLRADPSQVGVVAETEDDTQGRPRFLVFWDDKTPASWHYKPELGEVPPRRRNITNVITESCDSVIQVGVIKGGINIQN